MDPIFKNILAVIAGYIVGALVNFGLLSLGMSVIPAPVGVDMSDVNSMKENMHLFEFKHFITPFLAHALGTLAGAFTAAKIAGKYKFQIAMAVGALFLLGGIAMVMMTPSPTWFTITDLGLAYFPMAWLGAKLGGAANRQMA